MGLVRPRVFLLLYAAVSAVLAAFYFLHYPVPGFFARLGQLGAAAAGVLLCGAIGARVWKVWGGPPAEGAEGAFFRIGVGLPIVSLSLLLCGVLGAFTPISLLLILAALAFGSGKEGWMFVRSFPRDLREAASGWGPFVGGLAVFALALAVLCAFAPPSYYDSLVYHLALPAKYLQEGRVGFVPYNQYAHFPQNMEMLYGAFLALAGDNAAQLFNVGLAALTGLLMAVAGKSFLPAGSRTRWDLLLFATAPCALLLSSETYVEAPMAFATTLCVLAGVRALSSGDRRWWVLAGLFGGFCAGVKYTGVLTPMLLGFFALVWPRPRSGRDRALDFAVVGGVSFLVFLPWLIKNFVLTGGNPIFPFLPSFFPAKNVYLPVESARAYFQVLDEYKGSSSLLMEIFLMPFRLATNATSFGGGYDVTGDLGWALPLLLLPMAAALWKKGPVPRFLLAYLLAHVLLWSCMRPVLRFLFPVFPALCLVAGGGLSVLLAEAAPVVRGIAAAALTPFLLSNGVLFYGVESVRDPFPPALGWETRGEYLHKKIDGFTGLAWAGENLPADARVLLVGDQRGYYMPRAYVAPMALLPTPLRAWADAAGDGDGLRRELLKSGFTHLFFHAREAQRLKDYRVLDLTPAGRAAWDDFLARARPIYRDASVAIYDLHA